jgi:hypothetical protein
MADGFKTLKQRGNGVTAAPIQGGGGLKATGNGSNLVSMAHGEGDGRHGADRRWRWLRLKEEERGRGAGGPAWAERLSGVGRFQGKGAWATRRMRAKI